MMRTHVFVLATATMLVSFAAHAQQREPASQQQADATPASTPAIAPARAAQDVRAPRSLMGMVMGALIESAEQSARQARAASQARNATRMATDDLALPAPAEHARREEVAVQPRP